MIVIDGRQSAVSLANHTNLEELLTKLVEEESLETRIITDVILNDESFSELYPHQAEDIESSDIKSLEIRTVSMEEMASDVVEELPKVVNIMAGGSRQVASLLRRAELSEALEVLQDMIAVSRDFLTTIDVLRGCFSTGKSRDLTKLGDTIGDTLGEVADAMSNEDWMLVADLLEYEYLPACEGWRDIIAEVAKDVHAARAE